MSWALSRDEVHTLENISNYVSWISAGASLYVVVTFAIFPKKRKFPFRLTLFFSICAMMVSLSVGIGSFVRYRQSDPYTRDHSRLYEVTCTIQAFILQYFAAAATMWWLVLAYNLHAMVTYGFDWPPRYEKWYHLLAWSAGFIQTIPPLAMGQLGPAGLYCWIKASTHGEYEFSFFYGEMALELAVGSLFWPGVIRSFYKGVVERKSGTAGGDSSSGGSGGGGGGGHSGGDRYQYDPVSGIGRGRGSGTGSGTSTTSHSTRHNVFLRPLLFVVIFFLLFGLMFAQRLHQAISTTQSVTLVYIHEISVAGVGFWNCLMFGFTRDNFRLWRTGFRDVFAWLTARRVKTYKSNDPKRPLTLNTKQAGVNPV